MPTVYLVQIKSGNNPKRKYWYSDLEGAMFFCTIDIESSFLDGMNGFTLPVFVYKRNNEHSGSGGFIRPKDVEVIGIWDSTEEAINAISAMVISKKLSKNT